MADINKETRGEQPVFIPVQRATEGMLTAAVIHLKTYNPTIVKEVQAIYNQFPTQERKPILNIAEIMNIDEKLSDCAYRFIFENAGIRTVLFD